MSIEHEFQCYALVQDIELIYSELQEFMSVDYLKAINGASGAINTLKALTDLAIKSQSVELKEGLLSLREEMLELKEALISAKEENFDLKQKISGFEKPEFEKLVRKGAEYHTVDSNFGPYCPVCYENSNGRILLSNLGPMFSCSKCKYKRMS